MPILLQPEVSMKTLPSHDSAVLLQRVLKAYVRGKKERESEMKHGIIEKITMSTQTEGQLSPPPDQKMGPWIESHPVLRVLLIFSNPSNTHPLRLQAEEKCIRDALRGGKYGDRVIVDVLPACTIDDLARQLMTKTYEIIHFSGHADRSSALVKHTMNILMGEHNIDYMSFKDTSVVKKIEQAAEEVVRQLEWHLLHGSVSLPPSSPLDQGALHEADSRSSDSKISGDIDCLHGRGVVMHGRLHGEKLVHCPPPSPPLPVPVPLPPYPPTPHCPPVRPQIAAAKEGTVTPSSVCAPQAELHLQNLCLRLRPSSGGGGEGGGATVAVPPLGNASSSSSEIHDRAEGSDLYTEVNLVKMFSHKDLLEIGVGSLAFEGDHGHIAFVSPYTFSALLAKHCPPLQCVILNACGGHIQGEVLSSVVPQTVCFSGRISDKESIIFSRGFYDSIAEGHSVHRAFRDGSSRMELHALSPGVPPRREDSLVAGHLPLVTLLKNERLYRELHANTLESISQTARQKDAQLLADNAALLGENKKLRSLISYGMELLQSKDRDLEAMRAAIGVLASSGGGKGRQAHMAAIGIGSGGDGREEPIGRATRASGSSKQRHTSATSGRSDPAKSGSKHVKTAAWKHVSKSNVEGGTVASHPVKKPKWYKNIRSSGYGNVRFSSASDNVPTSSNGGVGASPQCHHHQQQQTAVESPPGPVPSSALTVQRSRRESVRSSPSRPLSASSESKRNARHAESKRGPSSAARREGGVSERVGAENLPPPELALCSSGQHAAQSSSNGSCTLFLTDDHFAGDVCPPEPNGPTHRTPPSPSRDKDNDRSQETSGHSGKAPKGSISSTSASPHRSQRQSFLRDQRRLQQHQHVISKYASWAKDYPVLPSEGGDGREGVPPVEVSDTCTSARYAPTSPPNIAAGCTGNDQRKTTNAPRPSQIQRGSAGRTLEKQTPSPSAPSTQSSSGNTSAMSSSSLSGDAGVSSGSRRNSSGFREKSAGFREFLKEMRSQQATQRPTSSFASSVTRFDQPRPSTSSANGVGVTPKSVREHKQCGHDSRDC